MKMSDVFELPVPPCLLDKYAWINLHDQASREDADSAAAQAINFHDDLVNALDMLLHNTELADFKAIRELLIKARGEIE